MSEQFLTHLDQKIQLKHLLNHEFYKAWSQGLLSKECLKEYAKEYYHHVKAFPTYLSALHSHTEDQETRKHLLTNLIEEEDGSPNHPELWKSFALALGNTEEEIIAHTPCCEIQSLIHVFRNQCLDGTVCEGLTALYAYESQIPEICISKIDGLKKHYGMQNHESWKYFIVHIAADKEHAAVERELIAKHINDNDAPAAMKSAEAILNHLWGFLSGLCERYDVKCA
ncbi:MAG: CADD family putative folate metabolism protein [Parachlamydiaceae bacterium]|nr:CADD family putative folate metabolism protein [Parachlamydiaceae bacterium]